jgi:hypothetical protein
MGYNVSHEIAKYIHLSVIDSTFNTLDFDSFLFYNLDRDRLEENLRK